jgi:uncharacterized protein DUF4105
MGGGAEGPRGRGGVSGVLAVLLTQVLSAQQPAPPPLRPSAPLPGSSLTISLVTMGVGVRVWERFGHNAILVEDRERGTRIAYNYGLFDFHQENFILRFVQGRMWYWMQGLDADAMLHAYIRENRSVWIQELDLPPAQRAELRDFLVWNERPENRYYQYDYYRDNCSTRVRDALDRVLGGRLRALTDTVATGTTYRSHTLRLTAADLPLYTALDIALGEPVDREITAWEEMFLPLSVREWVRRVTVTDSNGRERPLVRAERTLFVSSVPEPPTSPPARVPQFLAAGVLGGTMLAALARRAPSVFRWMGGAWGLVAGGAGLVLTCLWAFTDHMVAYRNENLFQASLFLLPLGIVLPAARTSARAHRLGLTLGTLAAAASILGVVLQVLPGLDQQNGEVLALLAPINIGLGWGVQRLEVGE